MEQSADEKVVRNMRVSILTRGKPRVEQIPSYDPICLEEFQSSLEENPEWNPLPLIVVPPIPVFQSSLEENPEWNIVVSGYF